MRTQAPSAHIEGMNKIPAAELTDAQNAVLIDHMATTTENTTRDQVRLMVRTCECGERFEVHPGDLPEGTDPEDALHSSWAGHVWEKVNEV